MRKNLMMLSIGALLACTQACGGGQKDLSSATDKGEGAVVSEGERGTKAEEGFAQLSSRCEGKILQWIEKGDATLELITADGRLWQIDLVSREAKVMRELEGGAEKYALLPNEGVILHFGEKAMVQSASTGQDYFALESRKGDKNLHVGDDLKSIAIHSPEGARYNIWDASGQFSGISGGETVQEFLHRQSPDFSMGFPEEPHALDLSNKRRVAVALDAPEESKQGLLYYMDEEREKGRLFNLGRTNTKVSYIDLSPNAEYLAVVDEGKKLYVTATLDKGFRAWAMQSDAVEWLVWQGRDLVLGSSKGIRSVNPFDGTTKWTKSENPYEYCQAFSDSILCVNGGQLDRIDKNGEINTRILLSAANYAVLTKDGKAGDLADSCLSK
ncbi:MAG: hypothetical protein WC966_05245 [Bradymonadales bacterium]|jgi:hypothetical protein